MSKILDLSVFKEETFDIKMLDGKMLHIKKPTQAMVIKVLELKDISENSEADKIIAALNNLTLDILNSNTDKVEITKEEVETLGFEMKIAIIQGYTDFLTTLQNDPNS